MTGSTQRKQVVGVAPEQHRLGEHPVPQRVEELRRPDVGLVVAGRPHRRVVVGAADAAGAGGPQRDGRATMTEQQVVGGRQSVEQQGASRSVRADAVPEHGHHVRLVHRDPVLDPVGQSLADQRGVLGEPVDGVAVQPAALVLESLRQVPVVEGHHRLDAAHEQPVDQTLVEVQALRVRRPRPVRLHPRPRDREAVAAQPEARHQVEILVEAVVVVAGDVAVRAVHDGAPAGGRRCPRCWVPCRPRWPPPRSGTTQCWHRTGSPVEAKGEARGSLCR